MWRSAANCTVGVPSCFGVDAARKYSGVADITELIRMALKEIMRKMHLATKRVSRRSFSVALKAFDHVKLPHAAFIHACVKLHGGARPTLKDTLCSEDSSSSILILALFLGICIMIDVRFSRCFLSG